MTSSGSTVSEKSSITFIIPTITTLFDASQEIRDYLAKIVANEPLDIAEEWKEKRPEDYKRVQKGTSPEIALGLNSPGEFYILDREPNTSVEQDFLDAISDRVFEEVREIRKRTTLTADEFAIFLLSQGTEWSDDEIASTVDIDASAVQEERDSARAKFRTSMRMIDLADRFADSELESELVQWRIHRDSLD